ncbi:hypothetical protein [Microbacterium sp. CJ77]|uniref:hypothetical protein n=1 Tax=unclassified Microbacterium TaxID=2609290 RepID=UPI001CA4EA73|nr:hypothetical protein [Microbacterium sp. CJ77]
MGKIDLAGQLGDARARVTSLAPPTGRAMANEMEAKAPPLVRGVAKYARLTRKETRLREDQYVELTQLARALMRRRTDRQERITENTLVRVAIDLLLANADQLVGDTEDALLQSVISEHPHSRTSGVPDSATSGVPRIGASAVERTARELS